MSTILLVEDDQFLSSLLKNRLTREGFTVFHADSGPAAIEILKTTRPDLMLLDLILPEKSGFEILEEIKSDPRLQGTKSIPVIITSNLGQESDLAKGKDLGVVDYFVKARISIDEIITKIRKILAAQK